MLSFFALTKSNSFPYSSLWGETHHVTRQTGPPRGGLTTRCSDTHGLGQTVGPGALDHIIQPNSSQTPSENSSKESDTSLERRTYKALKSSGEGKMGRGCRGYHTCTEQEEDIRRGDFSPFYSLVFHTSQAYED